MSPDAPISTLRFLLRAANSFLVDLLTETRGDWDFTDALILAALVQSNAAQLAGDPALQRRYGTFNDPPPDHIRRSISINALAASLGLPFETVRRRVKRRVAEGVCEVTPEGVRYVTATLRSAGHRRALEAIYVTARSFYIRLRKAGCLELMEPLPAGPAWEAAEPPLRVVFRTTNDYLLRMMEHLLPRFDTLSQAFITLAVVRANTADFPDSLRGEEGMGVDAFVPDSHRKPVAARDIAAQLGLPVETVRRNLLALTKDGRIQRAPGGFIVPAATLARPNVIAAWDANFRDLSRLFADLSEAGVLALWDTELTTDRTAA